MGDYREKEERTRKERKTRIFERGRSGKLGSWERKGGGRSSKLGYLGEEGTRKEGNLGAGE